MEAERMVSSGLEIASVKSEVDQDEGLAGVVNM